MFQYFFTTALAASLTLLACTGTPASAQNTPPIRQPGSVQRLPSVEEDNITLLELLELDVAQSPSAGVASVCSADMPVAVSKAAPMQSPAPLPEPVVLTPAAEVQAADACPSGCSSGCGGVRPPSRLDCFLSSCDMVQHYPYYPPLHGHYYFRPYSYNEMVAQREVALLIGEDRQNPYSNRIFAQIYRAYDERHPATVPAVPVPVVPVPPAPAVK
ncbi:MAG: hypothetical protein GXY83_23255 [Rhodopirellula sp.]|nr:hypothetical protein [Rhodopirellula sp.]